MFVWKGLNNALVLNLVAIHLGFGYYFFKKKCFHMENWPVTTLVDPRGGGGVYPLEPGTLLCSLEIDRFIRTNMRCFFISFLNTGSRSATTLQP